MLKTKIIVGISDAKVSCNPADVIVTYSLGSCIGVCVYDKIEQIGGMLHYQLPDSTMDHEQAKQKPFMFADTGLSALIRKLESIGAKKKKMQVKIAGGASLAMGPKGFDIGKRNRMAIRKTLWKNSMFIDAEDTGGSSARNMYLNIANGVVTIRSNSIEKTL